MPVRGVVFLGAKGGGIAAHNVEDGMRRWSAPKVNAAAGVVSLSDALIAAIDTNGTLVTFVAATGVPRWTAPAAAKSLLAADDTAVYVATKDGRLRSISRSDGKIRWTARAEVDLETKRKPAGIAAQGRLVVATDSGAVIAVDSRTGRHAWSISNQATADEAKLAMVVSGSTVYINGVTLTARNLGDGAEQWAKSEIFDGKSHPAGPPVLHGKTVYATAGLHIMGYSTSGGSEVWKSEKGYFMHSPVTVQGNAVCAINYTPQTNEDMEVWAIDRESRRRSWTYPLTDNVGSYVVEGSGNRIFVRDGGSLLALPAFA